MPFQYRISAVKKLCSWSHTILPSHGPILSALRGIGRLREAMCIFNISLSLHLYFFLLLVFVAHLVYLQTLIASPRNSIQLLIMQHNAVNGHTVEKTLTYPNYSWEACERDIFSSFASIVLISPSLLVSPSQHNQCICRIPPYQLPCRLFS